MKNAIITSSDSRFGDFVADHWYASLKANVDLRNVDVIILDYGFSDAQRDRLKGAIVVPCKKDARVNNIRFRDIYKVLSKQKYDQVLCTDGGDIIFQADLKEIFEKDKNSFRGIIEPVSFPYKELYSKKYFMQEYSKKMLGVLKGKRLINIGVLLGPYSKMKALCYEVNKEMIDQTAFGPDTVVVNYVFYRDGFVPLDEKYNFIFQVFKKKFKIIDGVFYFQSGEKIPIVHNAGNVTAFRPIENFGFGHDRNKLKKFSFFMVRIFLNFVDWMSRKNS